MRNLATSHLPKYTIGVVAGLVGLPPQMLRRFEESGLISPARQAGKNRLYSDQDVTTLQEIAELSEQGVNMIGIRYILQLRQEIHLLRQQLTNNPGESERRQFSEQ